MPPVPEGLSLLRWRWFQYMTRNEEVRFLYWAPCHATCHRRLGMFDREGYDIGVLEWTVCDHCRVGSFNKISIEDSFQRRGFGRRLSRRALADGPNYRWATTGQSPDAKPFFAELEQETGVTFPEYGGACAHLTSRRNHQSTPRRGRPQRPVLDRDT